MNTKNKILITILLIIIVIQVVLNLSVRFKLDKYVDENIQLRLEIEKSMITREELIENVIKVTDIVNGFHENVGILWDKYQYKQPVLIYGYSAKACDMCVSKDLIQLYKFQKNIGKDWICIFPAFDENKNNAIRLKTELSSFDYKNISELSSMPDRYYALIDVDGNMGMVFIPQIDSPELTESYFDIIKNRLKGHDVSD